MPSVSTSVCQNFSAAPGSPVEWTNIPPEGCTIEPVPGSAWPFTPGPPIKLPSPSNPPVKVAGSLKPGAYYFRPSCCGKPVCVTVT